MATHLFVQKFSRGEPAPLPYEAVLALLRHHGTPGRGPVGDLEVAFPGEEIAQEALLIGEAATGAACVAFVRPVIGDALRHLLFDLMTQVGAAVFDDALGCAYTIGDAADLPPAFAQACVSGVQRIGSPLQLWPAGLSAPAPARDRPALLYKNPNPQGVNYVMFDYAEMAQQHLHMDMELRAAACNPGTLRALRNVLLKVDTALVANAGYQVSYHFADPEANLLLLESPKVGELRAKANMVVSGEVALGGAAVAEPLFVADADWFFANRQKAADLRKQAGSQSMEIAPGIAGMAALDALLEKLHQAMLRERGTRAPNTDAYNEKLLRWADLAGACIGEAIRTGIGGQWGGITVIGLRHPVVRTHTGHNTWPKLLAFNRIMNGPTASVAAYVNALARTATSPTPRNADIAADIPQLAHMLLGHGQFQRGGLPLPSHVPVAQLDFTPASLRPLDAYLANVHAEQADIGRESLSNLALAAGAYLGEVVRRHAGAHWHWSNFDDFVAGRPADPNLTKNLNTCALLLGPGMAVLPMQACNVTGWGEAPRSVYAQAQDWLQPETVEEANNDGATGEAGHVGAASPRHSELPANISDAVAALKPEERHYVQVPMPGWIYGDDLQRLTNELPGLLLEGRVVWGHLVQANNLLFAAGEGDSPAEILYDPAGAAQPEDLALLARQLFQLKSGKPADPEERRVAEHLTSEVSRAFGMPVPRTLSQGGLLMSTVLVVRKHLPNHRLSLGHFPILISDRCKGCAMILPSRWWPRALAEEWGIEEPPAPAAAAGPAPVEPPHERAYKDTLLHVVKPPVPRSEEEAWNFLDQLLTEEEAWSAGEPDGMMGKLLGRRKAPEPRVPNPQFAKYLAHMRKEYPLVVDAPEDIGGEVLSINVAAGSVNYVVETARREFGLIVFSPGVFNIVYRPSK